MKYQYLFLLTTLLAQTETTPVTNPYPADFITDYMTSCKERSLAESIPPEDTEILCTCTINVFQDKYTFEEFQQLTAESENNNQEARDSLSEVGYICLDEILYED